MKLFASSPLVFSARENCTVLTFSAAMHETLDFHAALGRYK
jgi:hypothetical protein